MFYTARHLGLALFSLAVLALISFSLSRFAPNMAAVATQPSDVPAPTPYWRSPGAGHLRMQLALTLALGGAAIWIVAAARQGPDGEPWAYATLAMLLGYWLKA